MKCALYVDACWGLGDNIYCRPFVRALSDRYDVYLGTPWPELFEDLPVRFVYRRGMLRTQMKNVAAQPSSRWSPLPSGCRMAPRLAYSAHDLARGSVIQSLDRKLRGLIGKDAELRFDLPTFHRPGPVTRKPLALFRPVTVRREWHNTARNPLPEYLEALSRRLWHTHTIVSIADLADGEEWLLEPAPCAHFTFHKGELKVRQLLALVQAADIVVGGVGWIVPASIALKTRAFIVLGGHGGHNAPEKITDPRMDLSRIGFAMPERFCRCTSKLHDCNKSIPDLDRQFSDWTRRVGLNCSAAWPAAA
jgi:hypothetical protein